MYSKFSIAPEASAQGALHSVGDLEVLPGAQAQDRDLGSVGERERRLLGELVHAVDEFDAALIREVLVPQVLHRPGVGGQNVMI